MMKKTSLILLGILLLSVTTMRFNVFGRMFRSEPQAPPVKGMVYIPGGYFTMGSDQGKSDARPPHKVFVKGFYIDKYEVTNAQYKRFIDSTGHPAPYLDPQKYPWAEKYNWKNGTYPPGTAQLPVVLVSWDDANAYAQWAGKRLPTEAEWEKAAKGGKNFSYPWGNNWDSGKCNSRESGLNKAVRVDAYPQGVSAYGVFNMAGNVWEWCSDWYDPNFYGKSPSRNPIGPYRGATRVIRGGSWDTYGAERLRTFARESQFPSVKSYDLGFRCAKDGPEK